MKRDYFRQELQCDTVDCAPNLNKFLVIQKNKSFINYIFNVF